MFNAFPGILLVLFWLGLTFTAEAQTDFNRANQLYSSDQFREAASIYDSLIKNHGASPELFYNLGNALARSGDTGRAVLAYERGLLLNPMDAEIKANLEKVRQKNSLYERQEAYWEQPFLMISLNGWAGLLLLSVWILAVGVSVRFFSGKRVVQGIKNALLAASVLSLMAGMVALTGTWLQSKRSDRAVVLAPDSPLLISPFAGAALSTSLKSGEVIRAGEIHGEYQYVSNEEGKSGWVRVLDIEKVQ